MQLHTAPWYDLNATLPPPDIIEVDTQVLPEPWADLCARNHIRLYGVVGYENEPETIKFLPASKVIAGIVKRDEHLTYDTVIDSTSGNWSKSKALVIMQLLKREPNFPLKRVVAVVPSTLQAAKIAALEELPVVEVVRAKNSVEAMRTAKQLSEENGWLYTRQYWNPDNPAGYEGMAREIAFRLPRLGIWTCGVGSGGCFTGTVPVIRSALAGRKVHCVAVAVAAGDSVGGVRTEQGLLLDGKPGLSWRLHADSVKYVGLSLSLKLSAAIWKSHPNDPRKRVIGGESMGFAVAGGLLAAQELEFLGTLQLLQDHNGEIHMAFPIPDTRNPYREDYEKEGYAF